MATYDVAASANAYVDVVLRVFERNTGDVPLKIRSIKSRVPANALDVIRDEPYFHKFNHNGFTCLVHRMLLGGYLCGYVRSRYFLPSWKNACEASPVHGGITFIGDTLPTWVPKEKDLENTGLGIWYGFRANHALDMSPFISEHYNDSVRTYRDMPYMINECMKLVEYLSLLETPEGIAALAGMLFAYNELLEPMVVNI